MLQIIISPAKKMNVENDWMEAADVPEYIEDTIRLCDTVKSMDYKAQKALWQCNDKIAEENRQRFARMDLTMESRRLSGRTPALIAYEGIQYQYMAPKVFNGKQWNYVQSHLKILSGFYGILKPLDGVVPYRLEMQAKLCVDKSKNLYQFWNSKIYESLLKGFEDRDDKVILNLASKEYSKCIEKYVRADVRYITCIFAVNVNGQLKVKATLAKMARGEMVRYLSEVQAENLNTVKEFRALGFSFQPELSTESEYMFMKEA